MKRLTYSLIGVVSILLILIILAVTCRKALFQFAAVQYLKTKGIEVHFTVAELGVEKFRINDIEYGSRTKIPFVEFRLEPENYGLPKLRGVSLEISNLDLPDAQKIIEAFSSKPEDIEELGFQSAEKYCNLLRPIEIQTHISSISWNKNALPVEIRLLTRAGDSTTTLYSKGEFRNFSSQERISATKLNFETDIELNCLPGRVELALKKIESDVDSLGVAEPEIRIDKFKLSLQGGQLTLTDDNYAEVQLPLSLKMQGYYQDKNIGAEVASLVVSSRFSINSIKDGSGFFEAKGLRLKSPFDISATDFSFRYSNQTDGSEDVGTFSISGLKFINHLEKIYFQGVSSKGKLQSQGEDYLVSFELRDVTKTLNFKNLHARLRPAEDFYELKFAQNTPQIQLGPKLVEVFPLLKQLIQNAAGSLAISGTLSSVKGELKGPLSVKGQDILLKSEFGTMMDLNFKHTLTSISEFRSAENNFISADEIHAGPVIKDLHLVYQVKSLSKINVEKFKVSYDGMLLEADGFSVDPIRRSLTNFHGNVKNLDLEKLLMLALNDSLKAKGKLSGTVHIEVENKIPRIDGKLVSAEPGWIQYRPSSDSQSSLQISDGPMDMLYGYLYDFRYQTFTVDLDSDENYKMLMRFSTLGRNPAYVEGKPLKLNINVEQNLIAAIKTMMLTYDLPSKLKDHFEKAGTK